MRLGSGDTVEQPRADDEVFSTEVFEASQRSRRVDLDVGEAMNGYARHADQQAPGDLDRQRTTKIKVEDCRCRNWSR